MLLQLYVLYFGLAGVIALGPWTAAVVGLGLNYAAYEAEIYRAAHPGGAARRSGRRRRDRFVAARGAPPRHPAAGAADLRCPA